MTANQDAGINSLLTDPSTPFWAVEVIKVAMTKDPVDAANVLGVLARAFDARCKGGVC